MIYTQWISRWIATVRERIPGSIDNIDNIDNDVTEVSAANKEAT
ncbi:hypothetical protein [Photorhabdus sp. MH8.4]